MPSARLAQSSVRTNPTCPPVVACGNDGNKAVVSFLKHLLPQFSAMPPPKAKCLAIFVLELPACLPAPRISVSISFHHISSFLFVYPLHLFLYSSLYWALLYSHSFSIEETKARITLNPLRCDPSSTFSLAASLRAAARLSTNCQAGPFLFFC